MSSLLIHEKFGLTDAEAAEVLVFLAKCAKRELDEKETLAKAKEELNENQALFASFMMGYFSGLYTSWKDLEEHGIVIPELRERAEPFTTIYTNLSMGMEEEELKRELVAKFKSIREKKFREKAEFA